ncbi:MAG: hypothetical protein Q7T33_02080 [Dehalococcoidia bacterium]|nr:hypothetical protein [Dehalococcoidia bacterium]
MNQKEQLQESPAAKSRPQHTGRGSEMALYKLHFHFKSNEHPWAGQFESDRIKTDEQAIDWARRFQEFLPDYQVTLFKNFRVMQFEERP